VKVLNLKCNQKKKKKYSQKRKQWIDVQGWLERWSKYMRKWGRMYIYEESCKMVKYYQREVSAGACFRYVTDCNGIKVDLQKNCNMKVMKGWGEVMEIKSEKEEMSEKFKRRKVRLGLAERLLNKRRSGERNKQHWLEFLREMFPPMISLMYQPPPELNSSEEATTYGNKLNEKIPRFR
jgi:hypothetical protein